MTEPFFDGLTAASFEPHRATEFSVQLDERALPPLRLDDVTAYRPQPGAPRAEPFSLIFSGPPPMLEQRMYRLEHPALGTLELFLVPIGREPDGRFRYEAVFN